MLKKGHRQESLSAYGQPTDNPRVEVQKRPVRKEENFPVKKSRALKQIKEPLTIEREVRKRRAESKPKDERRLLLLPIAGTC